MSKESKSNLEIEAKLQLEKAGLDFCYECQTFVLIDPIEYPSWQKVGTKKKVFKRREKELATKYTPDFIGDGWIIETKGMQTEKFKLQWKLFKHYLAHNHLDYDLYMPTNKKEILLTIDLIIEKHKRRSLPSSDHNNDDSASDTY